MPEIQGLPAVRLGTDNQVSKGDLRDLLTEVRKDPNYRANSEKFEFRVKTEGNQRFLVLKEQSWFGRFKEAIGWDSGRRTQERSQALTALCSGLPGRTGGMLEKMLGQTAGEREKEKVAVYFTDGMVTSPQPKDGET
jgi:hypothetical protein